MKTTTVTIHIAEDDSVDHEAVWGQFQAIINEFQADSDKEFGSGKVTIEITSIEE